MSGYGGQPPGWQDPYGQSGWQPQPDYPQQSWQDPYAQQGYGYGPPGVPHGSASSGSAIGALVCNIMLIVMCLNVFAIPGIITSAMAMNRVNSDPESARRLTMWSWVIFAANVVIGIALIVIIIAVSASNSNSSYSDSGF